MITNAELKKSYEDWESAKGLVRKLEAGRAALPDQLKDAKAAANKLDEEAAKQAARGYVGAASVKIVEDSARAAEAAALHARSLDRLMKAVNEELDQARLTESEAKANALACRESYFSQITKEIERNIESDSELQQKFVDLWAAYNLFAPMRPADWDLVVADAMPKPESDLLDSSFESMKEKHLGFLDETAAC